uniref:Uncharacterized protein n=1 Tax=Amphimedon queenslandica TaxID=400682 RepID=A0A1X7SZK8_AMPQE
MDHIYQLIVNIQQLQNYPNKQHGEEVSTRLR